MEIEPTFAIKRLKLNLEKTVNSETLEEIKNTKNKTIDFKDWMKSVVENDIAELKNEIDRLKDIRDNLNEELIKELAKEEQNELQIKYLKKRIKHINLNIIVLKERIRFLSIEYDLKVEIDTIEIENTESNNNTETDDVETDNKGLLNEEQTPEPPTTIPSTPLIPAHNILLEHLLRRKKVIFLKELKRQDQIRRYEEYEAWKEYTDERYKETNSNKSILYGYKIPSDCLKIFDKNFELLEGNYIYSYLENGLVIKYLSNGTELYSREIKFNIALSYLLAYYICADLQNNDDKLQLFFRLKNNKISEARTANLREVGVEINKNYRWKK